MEPGANAVEHGRDVLELLETHGREERIMASWESPATPPMHRITLVSARYALTDPRLRQVVVKYAWASDEPDVSPQADILLQVLTDAAETALVKELGPVPSAVREDADTAPSLSPVSAVRDGPTG